MIKGNLQYENILAYFTNCDEFDISETIEDKKDFFVSTSKLFSKISSLQRLDFLIKTFNLK